MILIDTVKSLKKKRGIRMDVVVNQRPISVKLVCDHCDHEHEEPYEDFCNEYGEACDWRYSIWKCPECGYENEVEDQEWY